jgi:RNA polymerase-binding transcription factor DksA
MTTIDTDRFRSDLEQARERLQKVIENHDIGTSSLLEQTGELMSSSQDNHLADTASETYERELDEGLEEDARERLRQVEAALERIDAGEYGTCEVDGKPIPVERLEAVPWTTLCVEHARERSR